MKKEDKAPEKEAPKKSFLDKVKEKASNIANKTSDAIVNAKVTFEKECVTIDCFSLADIRDHANAKGKIDYKEKTVQFSGTLDTICKNLEKPWFFMDESGKVFDLDTKSIKQETITIKLKSKDDTHVTTVAKINVKILQLK